MLDIGPEGVLASQTEADNATGITLQCEGGLGSRRNKRSPAEEAIVKLSDEVIVALESEQRRSDASAERRCFAPGKNVEERSAGVWGDRLQEYRR